MTATDEMEKQAPSAGYLEKLIVRLATGLGNIPTPLREQHAQYLQSAQRPDGGFGGREGASDLYYTGFALRGLAISGSLFGPLADRAADFLRGQLTNQLTIVDFLSLLYSLKIIENSAGIEILAEQQAGWREQVTTIFDACHRDDGGYAKGPENPRSSTYHTFLTLLYLQILEKTPANPQSIANFFISQKRSDGGFVEFAPMKRSGTNPTAAAVAGLQILGQLSDEICAQTAEFLAGMQTAEGGLRANTRIPIADLLSSFTGLLTLVDLGAEDRIDREVLRSYALRMATAGGGFHGAAWDDGVDVEYTFYGLGTLAVLAGL
jgi:geranylgeranyl transferase type-2 subunit beta